MTSTIHERLHEKLRLSIGEAARVTGVSVRQLGYWTNKGLVRALGTPGRKRYDFKALERIELIKRHLNEGYGLEQAAHEADRVQRSARVARAAQPPYEAIVQRVGDDDRAGVDRSRRQAGVVVPTPVASLRRRP